MPPPATCARKPRTRSLADVREVVLRDGEAALEYYIGSRESYLLFITKEGITIEWLPPAGEIGNLVDLLRTKLSSPSIPEESVMKTAESSYLMLH